MRTSAIWSRVLQFLGAATVLVALVSLLPGDGWLVSLLSNLRLHLLAASVVLFVMTLAARQWLLSSALGALTVWALLLVQPQFVKETTPERAGLPTLEITTYNLSFRNRDYAKVRRYIDELPSDMVVLQEYTDAWQNELAALKSSYPYVIDAARNDAFGIAFLSRVPLKDARIEWFPVRGTPYTRATIDYNGHEIEVFGVHLAWPMTPAAFAARNRQIDYLADELRNSAKTALACGDFNLTSWSPWFSRMLVQGNVNGINAVSKHSGTWPAPLAALGIAIDHCLVRTPGLIAAKTGGPNMGSDHELTIFDIALPARAIQ